MNNRAKWGKYEVELHVETVTFKICAKGIWEEEERNYDLRMLTYLHEGVKEKRKRRMKFS